MTPGDLLVILMKHHGLTQAELAAQMGRPAQMLSEIAHGKKRVTAETALQLERALGLQARIWLSLQQEVDLGPPPAPYSTAGAGFILAAAAHECGGDCEICTGPFHDPTPK